MLYKGIVSFLFLLYFSRICYAADPSKIEIQQISPNTWTHTSYSTINVYTTDSHGLIVETPSGIVLIDTCWNVEQTASLIRNINSKFHLPIILAIITHAHQDRIGGIEALLNNNIRTISTSLTARKAAIAGYMKPSPDLDPKLTQLEFNGFRIEVFYPGPGHTEDNIVVWIPSDHVLFGGCLVKALENVSLGNVADANTEKWASSIQNLQIRYPNANIVVPGHGRIGSTDLLLHTIKLSSK